MKKIILLMFIGITGFGFGQTPGAGVTDIDSNFYNTVIIGSQEWMAENLRTSKYANGDTIPNITDGIGWYNLSTGAWCHYDNNVWYEVPYGKLYNWYAVYNSSNICPNGWHVPTNVEWTQLTGYLGGEAIAGGKMKSTGTLYWQSPNTSADNSSGFTGLPSGRRHSWGDFYNISTSNYLWSSTEIDTPRAWLRQLGHDYVQVIKYSQDKYSGNSVRCIKTSANTSVIELNNSLIKLFPNPSNDIINLSLAHHAIGQIILTDALGKEVLSKSFASSNVQMTLKSLASKGTYFAKVLDSDGNTIAIKKLLYH